MQNHIYDGVTFEPLPEPWKAIKYWYPTNSKMLGFTVLGGEYRIHRYVRQVHNKNITHDFWLMAQFRF